MTSGAHLVLEPTARQVAERARSGRKSLAKSDGGDARVSFDSVLGVAQALEVAGSLVASVDPRGTDLG